MIGLALLDVQAIVYAKPIQGEVSAEDKLNAVATKLMKQINVIRKDNFQWVDFHFWDL